MSDTAQSIESRTRRPPPQSPNIRNYKPQLTSVLSIANRITALASTLAIVAFVAWLVATEVSPRAYDAMYAAAASPAGRAFLVLATFAFFLHLCGSLRHLLWDAVLGFELRTIYATGWAAVAASIVLTAAAWVTGWLLKG
ncbi:MAG: succinate dehydrogenase, cytochrome b556 subunit, partial [Steroidobacteraceae bacterium]